VKLDPYSKNTWTLNMKSQVFLSAVHFLLVSMRTWGSLVMTFTREIVLLQWESKENSWIEITITHSKKT